jgi:hypothetical protein
MKLELIIAEKQTTVYDYNATGNQMALWSLISLRLFKCFDSRGSNSLFIFFQTAWKVHARRMAHSKWHIFVHFAWLRNDGLIESYFARRASFENETSIPAAQGNEKMPVWRLAHVKKTRGWIQQHGARIFQRRDWQSNVGLDWQSNVGLDWQSNVGLDWQSNVGLSFSGKLNKRLHLKSRHNTVEKD